MVKRWSAKRAERFMDDPIDEDTRLKDLVSRCIAGKGRFECNLGKFRFTVVLEK